MRSCSFKVYDVAVLSEKDLEVLHSFEETEEIDFWSMTRAVGSVATLMVSKVAQREFEQKLSSENMKFRVKITDVEKYDFSDLKSIF